MGGLSQPEPEAVKQVVVREFRRPVVDADKDLLRVGEEASDGVCEQEHPTVIRNAEPAHEG